MEKFFKWFIGIFLIFHGGIFLTVGIAILTTISVNEENNYLFFIFPIIGMITLSIGAIILSRNIKNNIRIKKLKVSGEKIRAEVIDIKKTSFQINRIPLCKLVARDEKGNIFYSDMILSNKLNLLYSIGDRVNVLISSENPKNYTVLLDL